MDDYVSKEWETLLNENGFRGFSDFWDLPSNWVEACNQGRGGWSGVIRKDLKDSAGHQYGVFIKRQENHVTRNLMSPLRGIPTFEREYNNLNRFRAAGLPTPFPVYFAKRIVEGRVQAILVTEELKGYKPLTLVLRDWFDAPSSLESRKPIIQGLGELIRKMHQHRFQHNALFTKHVWVKQGAKGLPEFKFLDLEKARRFLFEFYAWRKDLGTLNREFFSWEAKDRILFLKAYLGRKNEKKWRHLWKVLERRLKLRHPEMLKSTPELADDPRSVFHPAN